jgi:hypothetical protein
MFLCLIRNFIHLLLEKTWDNWHYKQNLAGQWDRGCYSPQNCKRSMKTWTDRIPMYLLQNIVYPYFHPTSQWPNQSSTLAHPPHTPEDSNLQLQWASQISEYKLIHKAAPLCVRHLWTSNTQPPEPLQTGPKFIWQIWLGMALGMSSWNTDTGIKSWNTQYLNLYMIKHILTSTENSL